MVECDDLGFWRGHRLLVMVLDFQKTFNKWAHGLVIHILTAQERASDEFHRTIVVSLKNLVLPDSGHVLDDVFTGC